MLKTIAEFTIFFFVIMQVMSLTSFTNKDDNPVAKGVQSAVVYAYGASEAVKPARPEDDQNENATALAQFAKVEAERIVHEGDVDGFVTHVNQEPAAKFLLGL